MNTYIWGEVKKEWADRRGNVMKWSDLFGISRNIKFLEITQSSPSLISNLSVIFSRLRLNLFPFMLFSLRGRHLVYLNLLQKFLSDWFSSPALLKERFILMNFEYMIKTDEEEYLPLELGMVEWSMKDGITNFHHQRINPGIWSQSIHLVLMWNLI